MIIVSDSSPLVGFAILGMLERLCDIFDDIKVPEAVYHELTVPGRPHYEEIRSFLENKVVPVKNKIASLMMQKEVDEGEAEAIILAIENKIEDILIDDFKGRRAAKTRGLIPIGTIGVLLEAKRRGYVKAIKPLMDKLIKNRIRIGVPLYKRAIQLAGEE
jgi:uncharacterized protein